jgi:hypothetical protein
MAGVKEPAAALLIVDLDKHIGNASHGATGSVNSFLIWRLAECKIVLTLV